MRHRLVEMGIEGFPELDVRVVIPRQKLSRDHFIDTNLFYPEVDRLLEPSLNLLLPDDRDDNSRGPLQLPAEIECRPDVCHRVLPPLLWIARRATTVRRPNLGVGLGIARIH